MNRIERLKPSRGFSGIIHGLLLAVLPVLAYVLVTMSFIPLAFTIVLLSKWRMLAVRPRYWPANIRANGVDIAVGLSFVSFIVEAPSQAWRVAWALAWGIWLIVIKPRSTVFWTSLQAGFGLVLPLGAIYLNWGNAPLISLVAATWLCCYISARHFMGSFDEPYTLLISHIWAYFGAALTWILGHWLIFYGQVSQPSLLLSVIGIGLSALYYLETNDSLSKFVRREIILIVGAVTLIVLILSPWGDSSV